MSDAELIRAKLTQVRRRQFVSLLLNSTSIALLAFVLLCGIALFASFRPPSILNSVFVVVLLTAAFMFSVFRMPKLKGTAKLVDQASGLQQRLETSLECIPPRDEMEELLLRDTSLRLSSIEPAAISPIHFQRSVGISLLACVLALSGLGVIRILQGANRDHAGTTGNKIQIVAGTMPQPKNPSKTAGQQNTEKAVPSVGYDMSAGPRRQSFKDDPMAETANQPTLQPAQGPAVASLPDKGAGKNQPIGSAAAGDSVMRANAGAASIRRAEKQADQHSGAPIASAAKADLGNLAKSGRVGLPSGKSGNISGKDAAFRAAYSQSYPSFWSAAEQALTKEKYPPGLKKYIADYFRAIHP